MATVTLSREQRAQIRVEAGARTAATIARIDAEVAEDARSAVEAGHALRRHLDNLLVLRRAELNALRERHGLEPIPDHTRHLRIDDAERWERLMSRLGVQLQRVTREGERLFRACDDAYAFLLRYEQVYRKPPSRIAHERYRVAHEAYMHNSQLAHRLHQIWAVLIQSHWDHYWRSDTVIVAIDCDVERCRARHARRHPRG